MSLPPEPLNPYLSAGQDSPWPTVSSPAGPAPATLGRRLAAFSLDFALTFCAALAAVVVGLTTGFAPFSDGLFGIFTLPWIAIALNTLGAWLFGSTLAQRMLGLRVVDPQSGGRIGLARTVLRTAVIVSPLLLLAVVTYTPMLRYVGYFSNGPSLFWVPVLVWVIMLVVAASSGRSLHDRAAGSIVVRLH